MSRDEIITLLDNIFHDILDDDTIKLKDESSARTIAGWDSVANIRLMLGVEDKFGFKFDLAEYSEFRTVGDLVSGIQQRVG